MRGGRWCMGRRRLGGGLGRGTQVDLCRKAFEFRPQFHRIAKALGFEHSSREQPEAPHEQPEQPDNVDEQEVDENNLPPDRNENSANEKHDENPKQDTSPGRKRTFKQFTEDTAASRRAAFYAAADETKALNETIHIFMAYQEASDARHHSLRQSRIELVRQSIDAQSKITASMNECHLQNGHLERLRVRAQEKIEQEACLTDLGKSAALKTLKGLESVVDGYFEVVNLNDEVRREWLKRHIRQVCEENGTWPHYYIPAEGEKWYEDEDEAEHQDEGVNTQLAEEEERNDFDERSDCFQSSPPPAPAAATPEPRHSAGAEELPSSVVRAPAIGLFGLDNLIDNVYFDDDAFQHSEEQDLIS